MRISPSIPPLGSYTRTTPSVVGFGKDGERMVGIVARRQAITNAEKTVYSAKRLIGRRFDESEKDVTRLPYKVVKAPNGACRVKIDDKVFTFVPPKDSFQIEFAEIDIATESTK